MADILIVDDIPANIQLLVELLAQTGHTIRPTTNPEFALTSATTSPPDLILLDVNMPHMSGFELCRTLKKQPPPLCNIPIIFISARNDTESIVEGFNAGGVDYISKPFNGEEVLIRVTTQLQLQEQRAHIEKLHQEEVDQLTQMNQLKDEVLRIASHDLRGPLAVIHACSELLLDGFNQLDSGRKELVQHILNSVGEMDAFLHDLLDVVYAEGKLDLKFSTVETSEYLNTILEKNLLAVQKKKIDLHFIKECAEPAYISIDERRFAQVLQNLLSNAIKYTPAGGIIKLGVSCDSDHVHLYVQDSGIGIPAEALPYLFDKFYRVESQQHQAEEGTGLGLAIAKALVEQNNGRIQVKSTEGVGSVFTVFLPRQTGD